MLKVIIVDDEENMHLILKKALKRFENVEIIGEAYDGEAAVEMLERLRPDGVFIDVEMPNVDGIEAAKLMLDIQPKVMLVFITAHQQYMPQAFELYAFDYMVKPFKLLRLEETVKRMQEMMIPQQAISPTITKKDVLIIKNHEETAVINQEDIFLIQRENRNTVIITLTDKHITSLTLSEVEEKLNKNIFMRSHKSYIINKTKINKLLPYGRWTFIVQFVGMEYDALITSEKKKELEQNI